MPYIRVCKECHNKHWQDAISKCPMCKVTNESAAIDLLFRCYDTLYHLVPNTPEINLVMKDLKIFLKKESRANV